MTSIPLSALAQLIFEFGRVGVISGKSIFATPLDDYWRKKMEEEAAAKESDARSA